MLEFIDGEITFAPKGFGREEKLYKQIFQEQHVSYPNLFNTCRNIWRYNECRPLVSEPFVTWRPAQGGQEQRNWP